MAESTVPAKREDAEIPATRDESRYLVPPVDIYEEGDGLVVVADLPGVKKDNLNVRVDNNILTIEGDPRYELPGAPVSEDFDLFRFYRQFELNDQVDQERIEADLKNGILTLRLPKAEAAKPRQITVQVA